PQLLPRFAPVPANGCRSWRGETEARPEGFHRQGPDARDLGRKGHRTSAVDPRWHRGGRRKRKGGARSGRNALGDGREARPRKHRDPAIHRQGEGMSAQKKLAVGDLSKRVGEEIGISPWLEVTQERIDLFAKAIDDPQWIHIDPERA